MCIGVSVCSYSVWIKSLVEQILYSMYHVPCFIFYCDYYYYFFLFLVFLVYIFVIVSCVLGLARSIVCCGVFCFDFDFGSSARWQRCKPLVSRSCYPSQDTWQSTCRWALLVDMFYATCFPRVCCPILSLWLWYPWYLGEYIFICFLFFYYIIFSVKFIRNIYK